VTIPAVLVGVAILGYVTIGAGGGAAGLGALASLALALVSLLRSRRDPEQAAVARRIAARALTLLPGALVVLLGFQAGGFFPGPTALAAVLLGLLLAARLARGAVVSRGAMAVGAAFAAYAGWVLLSGRWSHAPQRAVTEADLVLVYGLGFLLLATTVDGARDMRWVMRGLALGSFGVCLPALLSRILPRVWPIAASLDTARLSYPLTYWNALGLVAGLGIILCVGLTADDREPKLLKALSALAIPVLAVTLLLTFSRGAIAATIIGLVVYLLLGRPRAVLGALLAVGPATGIALAVAYRATSLARVLDGSAVQSSQGRHLALVVAACSLAGGMGRGLLAFGDARLVALAERHPLAPGVARRGWSAAIGLAVVASLAFGLPGALGRQYEKFVANNHGPGHLNLRDRLTDPGADGRIDHWRVALEEFDGAPLAGTGAGTFEVVWAARRPPNDGQVLDAHNIYLENLGELGIVGLALLGCVLVGILAVLAGRMRRPERPLYAAAFAVALAWTIHAAIDWDWEMPAVTLPVFALAGAALGGASPGRTARRRPLLALVVLAAAAVLALVGVSQSHLDASLAAFDRGDCAGASGAANSALAPLSFRPGAREILAYCHAARGERGPALAEMARAVGEDPRSWEPHYGLAVVQAALGGDPRPGLRAALALNPTEPVIRAAVAQYRADPPGRWAADAAVAPLPISGRYTTALAALRPAAGAGAGHRRSRAPR
jgi:O-antigen ligase